MGRAWRPVAAALLLAVGAVGTAGAGGRTVVYQEKSLYRNILVVEGGGYRCMTFGRFHAEQSCIQVAAPDLLAAEYTRGLFAAFLATPNAQRVLVIGLGGGVVPRAIRKVLPHVHVDSVELDPAVARVAESHFRFRPDARSQVFIDDGRVFVRKARRTGWQYDIIMVDAHEKDYIPEHLLTREFLEEMKSLLRPGGTLAANTFAAGALEAHERATYQAVFGPTYNLDLVGGNRIILAAKDGLRSMFELRAQGEILGERFASIGVRPSGILERLTVPAPTEARVLTDQYSPANLLMLYHRGASRRDGG